MLNTEMQVLKPEMQVLKTEILEWAPAQNMLSFICRTSLSQKSKTLKEQLQKAREIQNEICGIEKDENYLGDNDLQNLEDRVVNVRKVLAESQSKDWVQKFEYLKLMFFPPSSRISSCVRTVDTVMCLHTWRIPAV